MMKLATTQFFTLNGDTMIEKLKRGRPKAIKKSAKLWELFEQYVERVKQNPIKVQDFVGKDGDEVERKRERPLTMEGFENFLEDQGIINDLGDYMRNKDGRYSDFAPICSRIKRSIRQDQIEGGMAGIYNPSITQRLNGLTEKVEESGSKEVKVTVKYDRKGNNPSAASPGADGGDTE